MLVIHSWWGLTSSFTDYADRLAHHGFVAGCADLFEGRTASTEQEARALRAARRREPAYRRLGRCVDELLAHPASTGELPGGSARSASSTIPANPANPANPASLHGATRHPGSVGSATHPVTTGAPGPAGIVGFSMGGHWALWLAQQPDPRISRAAAYYAARGGDYASASSPVLAHFADRDPFVSAGSRRSMTRALHATGRPYVAHDYPGTHHWFAESAHPYYDPAAADAALRTTVTFLAGA